MPPRRRRGVNDRINSFGHTALICASGPSGNPEKVKQLLKEVDIDVNKTDTTNGNTALIMASIWQKIETVKLLLEHPDIDVNKAETKYGRTALVIAKQSGYAEIVRLLELAW